MPSAAFVQLGCIYLHPSPNAAGIHLDTMFGHQLGDVLVGERIPQIPAHARITSPGYWLAPFERMVRVDRNGLLPYQDAGSEVRNGTPFLVAALTDGRSQTEPLPKFRQKRGMRRRSFSVAQVFLS